MAAGKHRTKANMKPKTPEAELGLKLLIRTVTIINYFHQKNPNLLFYIENPATGLMKYEPILHDLPDHKMQVVSYCKYGFTYQKATAIWTNDPNWVPRSKCTKKNPCEHKVGNVHIKGVRSHPEYGQTAGPQTLADRYRMPPELLAEIFPDTSAIAIAEPGVADFR
jgi:hypothetical protein